MNGNLHMNWSSCLPTALIEQAYQFNGEMAWKKDAAVIVLGVLKASEYLVLGVDVWIPTLDGPRVPSEFVYDWDLMAGQTRAYANSAKEFIENFQWSEGILKIKATSRFL
jgi:hypothetical protein